VENLLMMKLFLGPLAPKTALKKVETLLEIEEVLEVNDSA
jgi:hypothetical protein